MSVTHKQQPLVVLVHGLWMGAWAMRLLQYRLQRDGAHCRCFSYATVRKGLAENAAALHAFLVTQQAERLQLVGHSLGGRLLLEYLYRYHPDNVDRMVMLGSPLMGSVVAKRLDQTAVGRVLIGRSVREGLLDAVPVGAALPAIGMIAGSRNMGLGRVVGVSIPGGDGTVAMAETRWPGLAAHLSLPVTHTGLLVSPRVALATRYFLQHGRFDASVRA